jgi:hypothetical protein
MRDAFINAVLLDVPKIDYASKIAKTILDDAIKQFPPSVAKAYKEFPEYFENKGIYQEGYGRIYGPFGNKKLTEEGAAEVTRLNALNTEQYKLHANLSDKLHSVAYAASTRKALVEVLPEFVKYMPEVEAPLSRQVPVLANLVADFVQAGWPKSNKGKIAKAKAAMQTA